MVSVMTSRIIILMRVSTASLRDEHLEDWVEKNLDEDVSGYGNRTDEDGLGNYHLWLR
jgi:hypothetical protein